jgi:diguanylate cyclase (GGDEF)-like protein/PAS domain S-box-containing protein
MTVSNAAKIRSLTPLRGIALFGTLSFLPLWLLAYLALTTTEDAMLEQTRRHLQSTSAVVSVFVAQHFSGLAELVDAYATRPQLIAAVGNGDSSKAKVGMLALHLGQLQKTRAGIAAAFVADMQGKLIAFVPETRAIVGRDFSHRDWYRGAKSSPHPYVSEVYISAAAGQPHVVGVAALLRDASRGAEPVGILVVAYRTQTVQEFAEQFARAQGVRLSITDQRGVLVADPSQPLPDALTRLDRPGVAAALRGETGIARATERDGPAILAYAPVAGSGWSVTSSVSLQQAFAPMRKLRNTVLAITALLTAVLMLGLVLFYLTLRAGRRADSLARRDARRMQGMIEAAHDAFVSIDTSGRVTAWNAQAERTFGWSRDQMLGRQLSDTIVPPELREVYLRGFAQLLETGDAPILNQRTEASALKADGSTLPVELAVWIGVTGEHPEFSAFVHDITERKQAEAALSALHDELRISARTDALTGLGNRLRLAEDLNVLQARSTRYGHSYALALIDIDFFKLYNDSCGHLAGDETLRQVAAAIAHAARSGDTVYRYGGEEFLCILPEQSLATGFIAAERIRKAVEELRLPHPKAAAGMVTISVGVACRPAHDPRSIEQMLQNADEALYLAKQQGRNRVRSHDGSSSGAAALALAVPAVEVPGAKGNTG